MASSSAVAAERKIRMLLIMVPKRKKPSVPPVVSTCPVTNVGHLLIPKQLIPSTPVDFGGSNVPSSEDYNNEIRLRYVFGLQIMIELQCEALVKEFKVTPLICGLVGPIWLRFVAKTGVFDEDWANKVLHDSEMQKEGPLFSEDDAGTIKEREVFINKKFATEKSNVISEKKPLPADIQSAFVIQIKSRHARSEKLHREGRLKVMLNSDGEIENQEDSDKETEDTEVGSSTV
ncbi:hypothetical protein RYX36_002283 [Vicia faba]